jgi:hypothetical protein
MEKNAKSSKVAFFTRRSPFLVAAYGSGIPSCHGDIFCGYYLAVLTDYPRI